MSNLSIEQTIARIGEPDRAAMAAAADRQGRLTKPAGSLGRLEEVAGRLAGILGQAVPRVRERLIVVAAADHGVAAEGVSAYPAEVTGQMVLNFLRGGAAINVLARLAGARVVIVDAGVAASLPEHPRLVRAAVGRGTANMARGPAMTREQARACLERGIELARREIERGADLVGTGDMGIGNTTAASAVTSAVTGRPPAEVTGSGTGISEAQRARKAAVIEQALRRNRPDAADGVDVLARVGGFELGFLAGVMLGAAAERRAVILDGFISGAAALIAFTLCPRVREFMIASHRSAEPGHAAVLAHLGLQPLLDLGLRLGEGTGAALAMPVVEAAVRCLADMATFDEAGVSGKAPG
jgi:nicotinate-nucleotide--dimethylbenzimidazole phosphoribosyltransferase